MRKVLLFILIAYSFMCQASSPIIGILDTYSNNVTYVPQTYINAVKMGGGVPVIIPLTTDTALMRATLERIDGIVFPGGGDLNSSYWGEKQSEYSGEPNALRDSCDVNMIRLAIEMRVPIMAICRGMQVMNVVDGGTLYQDLEHERGLKKETHSQVEDGSVATHMIHINTDSRLASILGKTEIMTNSHHHQAVKLCGKNFHIAASSDDGVVEALEPKDSSRNILALQFHPEKMAAINTDMLKIFSSWVKSISNHTYR